MLRIIAIIPARMSASRFPGKPLAPILGKPMIEYVFRAAEKCESLEAVYVATCDEEIANTVAAFGGRAIITSSAHQRASDRVAEAAARIEESEGLKSDIVIMVQGDEPLVTPAMMEAALAPMLLDASIPCVNLVHRISTRDEYFDPNTIKVVMNSRWDALYFSRTAIPHSALNGEGSVAVFKQVCVIPFRREFLETFAQLKPTPLECAESIDMLRALENGFRVHLVETGIPTHAVDTPEDLLLVESLMRRQISTD